MAQAGYSRSPFQEGSAALREEPLLLVAELTWRWCFGIAAWLLLLLAAAVFLDSLNVSEADRLLLGTMKPALERSALDHIFHGTLLRYLWIKFFVLAGLTVLWAFAAAAGRAAVLRNLVALAGGDDREEDAGWQFRPMFQLHLSRALWMWTAIGCFVASFLLGNAMMRAGHAARGSFFYVFGVALSIVFGVMLNWIFGLAPLFCIRDQVNAPKAISLTLDFCARQGGRLFGLSMGFLALRILWAGSMFLLVLAPVGLADHIAVGWVLVLMFLMAMVYFAGADALYLARLGAYAALAEIDAEPAPEPGLPPEPLPDPEQSSTPPHPPLGEWESGPTGFSPSS